LRSVILVGSTLLALAASGAGAQQPVFRSGLDLVTARATALDRRGGFVTDLTAADFEIYEDGKKQTIKYFAPCDAQEHDESLPSPELHLGVLLDISGSMEEDLKLARTAAIKFLNTLVDAVDITLVDFDTEVRVALYGQNDFPRLVERVRTRRAEGYTALYDAIGVYLDGAGSQRGRKVLVLYTDGGDNASNLTFSELLSLLKASDVTVYSIGFLEHQLSSTKMEQRMQLQQIAEVTGGQLLLPTSIKELESAYEKVRQEIAAQYTLGYVSTNERTDGAWRKIEIKVTRPDLKDVRIRARKGYFGPYKPTGRVSRRDGPQAAF
jgi:Ca-activated chloride channel family protein